VNFVGVAGRDDLSEMQDFVSTYGVEAFDHIADEDVAIWREFGVTSQPAFVFIDDAGEVEVLISSLGEDGLIEKVEALLS
jgi:peroxiredoxin